MNKTDETETLKEMFILPLVFLRFTSNVKTSQGNIGGYLSFPYMQQLYTYMALGVNTRKTVFHSKYLQKKY